jgi:hypothetical protein
MPRISYRILPKFKRASAILRTDSLQLSNARVCQVNRVAAASMRVAMEISHIAQKKSSKSRECVRFLLTAPLHGRNSDSCVRRAIRAATE